VSKKENPAASKAVSSTVVSSLMATNHPHTLTSSLSPPQRQRRYSPNAAEPALSSFPASPNEQVAWLSARASRCAREADYFNVFSPRLAKERVEDWVLHLPLHPSIAFSPVR